MRLRRLLIALVVLVAVAASVLSLGLTSTPAGALTPTMITISNLPVSGTYGGGFTATVSTDGDGVTSVTSSTPSVCTASGLIVTYVGVGTCSLNAQVAAGMNYTAATGSAQTIPINMATPTMITISNLPVSGTNGGGFTAAVSTDGDGVTSVTSSTPSVCTASGLIVTYVGVGTCSLNAQVAAGTNYTAATGTAQTIPVGKKTPTMITISNLPVSGTNGGGFTATVSTDGDGVTSVTSSTPSVCTASGLTVTYVGVGTCSLNAQVAAGTNYTAATGTAQTIPVGKKTPTMITISNLPGSGTYGGGFTATVSTDGDGPKSVTSSTPSVCTASGLTVTYVGVGTCSLNAQVAAGTNYTAASGTAQTIPVAPKTPTMITITNLPGSGTYGGGFTATVNTDGDGPKSVTSNTPGVCAASGLTVSYVGVGTCSLTAHVGPGTNYTAADGSRADRTQHRPGHCDDSGHQQHPVARQRVRGLHGELGDDGRRHDVGHVQHEQRLQRRSERDHRHFRGLRHLLADAQRGAGPELLRRNGEPPDLLREGGFPRLLAGGL